MRAYILHYKITNNTIKLKDFDFEYQSINFLGNEYDGLGV